MSLDVSIDLGLGEFDLVLSVYVLEHVADPGRFADYLAMLPDQTGLDLEEVAGEGPLLEATYEAWYGVPTMPRIDATPTTRAAKTTIWRSIPNGCGGSLDCGTCTSPQTCGGSGLANVEEHLERRAISVTPEQADAIVMRVKQISIEKKALLTDAEFDDVVQSVREQVVE